MKNNKSNLADKWDNYWKKNNEIDKTYSAIATFYRIYIIKRAINYFIKSNFSKNSTLLHAGCGTGQVDTDLNKIYKLTALDISSEALKLYKMNNGSKSKIIKSDVLKINLPAESYDGIYNLGLMEHFTKKENGIILKQFNKVLKNNGKIILFWPPKYGISVIFLNSLHFFLNKILKLNIRLHPDEISLIDKKKDVELLLNGAGFKLEKYYFGPIDMFTHRIIVATKIK